MFIDTRLSDCVAYGFQGGPEWDTQVVILGNGRTRRNAQWLYPIHRYSAQYMNLEAEAKDAILSAFHACRGQLHCFRFKDWNDYEADDELLAPNIGTDDPVQLMKSYTFGTETSSRPIQAIVSGTVKRNGVTVPGTLDLATGIFTPTSNWVAGTINWSGEFDVWVRFASDYNAFAIGNLNAHTSDIELVEERR